MFDRGVLFVGAEGVGLGMLAEALALDALRNAAGSMPLRVFSATASNAADCDPVMLRAMRRLNLDTHGLSLKPLALYAFAGAPRIDHVVLLGAKLPAATRLALGEVDVRSWDVTVPPAESDGSAPGARYQGFLALAEQLRVPVRELVDELSQMDAVTGSSFAHTG